MYKLLYVLFSLMLFISCSTSKHTDKTVIESTETAVPITNTKIEYRDRILHDSIVSHDSVYMYIKGDTVFKYKEKVNIKYLIKIDTICKTDTIKVPVTITSKTSQSTTEIKEVHSLYWWQKVFMWLGILVFTASIILLVMKIKKKYF